MTTNIPKEQGHTLKQTMLNTLLLNLKTTVPRLQKEHQNCSKNNIKTTPNQHQNCNINQHLYNIKPAKNSTKTAAKNQHLYIIKPTPKQHQNCSKKQYQNEPLMRTINELKKAMSVNLQRKRKNATVSTYKERGRMQQ